jgi:hypothetical protein
MSAEIIVFVVDVGELMLESYPDDTKYTTVIHAHAPAV